VSDVRRLKQLESENTKLKRILAEPMLVNDGLREIVKEKC
jgi:putative transposase